MSRGGRRVQPLRHRRVVVAVAAPNVVGFAGFAELLQRVLAHGFQQPVSRSTIGVFGDDERLVDEQAELVEHLEPLDICGACDGLGGVEVEPAHEHR